mmetsp:Transcript_64412/g.162109  ORF Transcript_64412/g.162109 Transcript_64412/m.162109 type:complete len:214 (-) Transcript_64412:489-1130(-)
MVFPHCIQRLLLRLQAQLQGFCLLVRGLGPAPNLIFETLHPLFQSLLRAVDGVHRDLLDANLCFGSPFLRLARGGLRRLDDPASILLRSSSGGLATCEAAPKFVLSSLQGLDLCRERCPPNPSLASRLLSDAQQARLASRDLRLHSPDRRTSFCERCDLTIANQRLGANLQDVSPHALDQAGHIRLQHCLLLQIRHPLQTRTPRLASSALQAL